MIRIPDCEQQDVELVIACFSDWIKDVQPVIVRVTRHMIRPHLSDTRVIELVQQISMHIWRTAQRKGVSCTGQLMNSQWSDEYFTINIPIGVEFGVIRFERGSPERLDVSLGFPNPVGFMTHLGISHMQDRKVEYEGTRMTLRHVGFLVYCEHMKAGLSAPFRDMISDGEL